MSLLRAAACAVVLVGAGCASTPQPAFVSEHDQAMESMCASMSDVAARCRCEAGHLEGQAVQQSDPVIRAQLRLTASDQWLCGNEPERARKALKRILIDPGTPAAARSQAEARLAELAP